MVLTRDEIFACDDLPSKTILVKGWGNKEIRIRALSAKAAEEVQHELREKLQRAKATVDAAPDGDARKAAVKEVVGDLFSSVDYMARICVRAIVDEQGNRIFTDADADRLKEKSPIVLNYIFNQINALHEPAQDEVEKQAKNLPETSNDDSPSDSASSSEDSLTQTNSSDE